MKKTWIFFKLRMLQLKSDKTALFFSYIFPVLLLIGIGYANQQNKPVITINYNDQVSTVQSQQFIDALKSQDLLKLVDNSADSKTIEDGIKNNDIKHYLQIVPSVSNPLSYNIKHNNLNANLLENNAVDGIINHVINPVANGLSIANLESEKQTSYLTILLPGLVGMTLLIIGLNGFGTVLIEEEHRGLYKNIKTIDVSPFPFLAGLLLSRLLVCYTVTILLFLIGVFMFHISTNINYGLLFVVVTLGSIAFLGTGLMISAISPSVSAFNGIVNFVQLPFVVLGGVFFSIAAFPQWVQVISNALPLTEMNAAIQKIIFQSTTFENIGTITGELSVLIAWCLLTLFISYRKFRW